MKKLRFWVAILSLWLIFFFNIERILLVDKVNIIQSNTYIFVAVVAIAVLLLPRLRGFSFSVLLIVLASLFLLDWYLNPSWEKNVSANFAHLNATALLTIIQLNAIILTGLLARQITYQLEEFEGVIAAITFSQIGKRPGVFAEEQGAMYREIKRARYYERPLAVMALKVEETSFQTALPHIIEDVQKAMMKEFTLASIARTLNENLHGFDTIALRDNYFIIVLPETKADAVPHIAQRVTKTITEKTGADLQVGTAIFPDEAQTFERLIEMAMENSNHRTVTRFEPSAQHYSEISLSLDSDSP